VPVSSVASNADGPKEAVIRRIEEVGGPLAQLHPHSGDEELARYAFLRVPAHDAERVISQLLASSDVEAAYAKPASEAPG
jgi:hypothetical protein